MAVRVPDVDGYRGTRCRAKRGQLKDLSCEKKTAQKCQVVLQARTVFWSACPPVDNFRPRAPRLNQHRGTSLTRKRPLLVLGRLFLSLSPSLSPPSPTKPTTPCPPYDARHRIQRFRGTSTERETHSPPLDSRQASRGAGGGSSISREGARVKPCTLNSAP